MPRVPAPLGLIANPLAGRDVRRLVANASTTSLVDKVTRLRRVLVGAVEAGVNTVLVQPDPSRICARALDPLQLDPEVEEVAIEQRFDESDTVAAASAMRSAGVGAVVALGGDGTSRAVALGWPDVPLVALSTGTNNVFPIAFEATVAGMAAGLVATGRVPVDAASRAAKVVRLVLPSGARDVALVDVSLLDEPVLGSLLPARPEALRLLVLSRAEPASVGMSAIGGLVEPCGADEDAGVAVVLGTGGRAVRAPLAPGLYEDVPVLRCERLALREELSIGGPGVLSLDGDRRHLLGPDDEVSLRVVRDGPRVIDVERAIRAAGGYRTE
ncbi:NAD(+)/NADH kinase [soil metagenome]